MTDPGFPPPSTPPPPGWWQASDGQWYPPHLHPTNPQPTPGWYAPAAPTGTNGFAIASMVLGIVWIYGIGSILALVFGYKARREIARSQGRQGGGGMAMAGIVLGWIGLAGLALVITLVVAVGDSLDDYNSDPRNGVCNEERFWEDPDC